MKTIPCFLFVLAILPLKLFSQRFVTDAQSSTFKTVTFKVYGKCGTCKTAIESSLKKKDGVQDRNWDQESKMIIVTYDSTLISLEKIQQKIANAGHDTDNLKASDEAYNRLAPCCRYRDIRHQE